MNKLKKVNEDKKELTQKLEWSEKFWKDKLTTLEKDYQSMEQKQSSVSNERDKYKELYTTLQSE
jgi:hypothetical protein